MPGTLLLDDWQNAVQDRLNEHIKSLQASTQSALQAVAQPAQQVVQALPQIDSNAVQQRLSGLVDSLTQQNAQPAAQVFQPIGQDLQNQAGQTFAPMGEAKDAIAQRLQAHVDSLTAPQAPTIQTLGAPAAQQADVLGAPPSADTLGQQGNRSTSGLGPIDASSPSAFARSIAPYAQYAATKLGIDPTWVAAMAGSESNYGKAQGNELFGVKALPGQPGTTMMTHEGEYGGTQQNATFASYASPLDAVNAWVDLIKNHYPGAVNAQDLPTFIHGLRQGGYFTAAEPEYLGIVKGIGDRIGADVQAGLQAAGIAPKGQVPSVTTAQARAADLGYKDVSQFGDPQLTNAEAYAACGPAAAVRFAERFGRNPTLREATDLAKQVGWTEDSGMAGISSQQSLMTKLGVPTKLVQGAQWDQFAKEAQSGNPVTISTPGHYFYADGYDAASGAFHVGRSGLDLRGGSEWMTPQQMESRMGAAQGALFADNPQVPTQSAAQTAGAATERPATQVIAAVGQPTALGEAGRRPANEVVPQTLGDIAQGVGGAFSGLGSAAQGVLGAAQEANKATPGTAAVNAVGQVASDLGSAVSGAYGLNRPPEELAARSQQYQQDVLAAAQAMNKRSQEPQTLGGTASDAWNLLIGANPPMGMSLQQYQDMQQAKNTWIEQNNPAKDVLLVGGVTSAIAQQLTDPLMIATFGPSVGAGRAIGAGVGRGVEATLADQLSPQAVKFVATVADKLASGAFIGGVQNALFEAEKPNATAESVFDALWKGAALGGAVEVGGAALARSVLPIVRRIGQSLIDNAPQLRAALRNRQPAQAEINAALGGAPEAAARVGERLGRPAEEAPGVTPAATSVDRTPITEGGLGTPRYDYPTGTTPQVIADGLRQAAEQHPTGVAHVDGPTLGAMPSLPRPSTPDAPVPAWQQGISPHLDDLRYAQDVGMNQSQWYSKFAQSVAQVVGDKNVNEFRTLFGITSQQTAPTENLQYTLGLMRMAREFTANGTDFTVNNIKNWIADNPRVTSIGTEGAKWKMNTDQFKKVAQLYTTGEVKVATNAKTSSYASNILSALLNRFDPNSTMDTWMAQIFNYKNPNRTASSDQAFQAMRTVVDHLAGETGQVPHQAQAAMWFAIKGAKDFAASKAASPVLKAMVKDFTNGRATLRQVLDKAGSEGAYANPTGTWEQVAADKGVASELAKLQPHLAADAPRPAIADSSYLYYPGKGTPIKGASTIAGRAPRTSGVVPETTMARAAQAERQAGVAQTEIPQAAADRLGYDPETRQFAELRGVPHEVQGDQVLVPGGNMDTLRYVAAKIHEASGADATPATLYTYRPESPEHVGWEIVDIPADRRVAFLDDLHAAGIGYQELHGGTIGVNALPVGSDSYEQALGAAVTRAGAQTEELFGRIQTVSPADAQSTLSQYGARYGAADVGGLSEPGRGVADTAAGFRTPGNIGQFFNPSSRARGEATPAFGVNLAGAAVGGYAGNAATPEDAPLDVRLRNIALGAGAGLLGTQALRRGGGRLADAIAARAEARGRAPESTGFRAPGGPEPIVGVRAGNPHTLREAISGETPMTTDELAQHADTLSERYQANADRLAAIDELLRNPGAKPERPPWAGGFSNDQVAEMAAKVGRSAYEPLWWEKAGLETGSGEVRALLNESGIQRGMGQREPTPADLRREAARLTRDQQHLVAAGEQVGNLPADARVVRPQVQTRALPFGEGDLTPPTGGGASPELDRLNAMYDGKKPAPATSVPDRLQQVGDSLTRMFTDRQVDINRAQERYAANLGRPLRGDEMAAELQRLASDPAAQVKVDQGLKPAIQSVGSDYPALRNYVTLRSNIEIADNLATRTGKPEVGTDRLFSGGLSRDESVKAMQDLEQQLGPERFATVQAAADQVTAFNKSLRERLVDAGVLDEGTAAQLEAQYPNWAKTRILDYMADPTGGQGAGTKIGLSDRQLREYTLKGTERAREDPVASTVAYAHQVERMAMKNEAFNAFLQIDQAGAKPMLREVPQSYTPKANEVTMIGFVDGQKTKYVTDNQALGAAINGAGVMSTPEWTSAWQKIFRSLATSRNPAFLAGNAALDIPTYVLRSSVREGGPQALPRIMGELARGYGDAFQGLLQGEFKGENTARFLKGGGGQAGYFTGGEGQTKRAVAEMQRKNVFQINGAQDMWRLTKDLLTLHPVEALGERIELGPRVAAMRLAERRSANPTQAIIDGRTVTVDFSQGGTVTKYLNNFIPFFNVGFQGPAQIVRAYRDNPRAFVATVGTLIGIPSAAAEVWNRSDPQRAKDYADVPQYVKDQGVVIMLPGEAPVDKQGNRKPMYALIKLREWTPFATIAREAAGRVMGDDSRSWQEMASSTLSGLSPIQAQSAAQVGTEPLGGIPILPAAAQLQMNTDFFRGRTIVSQRADQNASAVSKAITPAIQAIVDRAGINAEVRPSAIDFLVRNQGAGVGGAALSASDLAAGEPSDTAGATGLPVVGGLIGRFAGNQTGDELQQARDRTLTAEGRQTLRSNGITLTPGAVSSSINQIPLKIDEETRYQQLANQYIDEAIQRTAASADFASKTQVGKQSMMDQAMQAARQKAGTQVLNTIPADEKSRRLKAKSTAPAAA